MPSVNTLVQQLGHFLKGRKAHKQLVSKGIENPEEVVPQLLSILESKEGKIKNKTQQVLNEISNQVDLIDILIKIPVVKTLWTATDPDEAVYCIDIGKLKGRDVVAVGSRDKKVYVWNKNGQIMWRGLQPTSGISCIKIGKLGETDVVAAGSGKAFGSSKENNVYVWNSNGEILWQGIETEAWVSSVDIGKLGNRDVVVAGCGGLFLKSTNLFVWNKKGKILWKSNEPDSWVSKVKIGRLKGEDVVVATSGDNSVYVWDKNGKLLWKGTESSGSLVDLEVGELNDTEVVVGISSNVYVWNNKGKLLLKVEDSDSWLRSVAIGSFGGKDVIIGGSSGHTLYGWDTRGNMFFKEEDPDGEINNVEIGKVSGRHVLGIGCRDSNVYMWEEGSDEPWEATAPNDEVYDIKIGKLGNKNVIAACSRDKNVYIFEAKFSSVKQMLDNLEKQISSPDLRKRYEELTESVNSPSADMKDELDIKVRKLAKKIERRQREYNNISRKIKNIENSLTKFQQRDIDVKDFPKRTKRAKRAIKSGDMSKGSNIIKNVEKEIKSIQNEFRKKKRKRKQFEKWVKGLDVEIDEIDEGLREKLMPIYEKYYEIEKDDSIDNSIENIRSDIKQTKKVSQKLVNVRNNRNYYGTLAQELNNFIEKHRMRLNQGLQKIKQLKKQKEQYVMKINDPAKTIVMQYKSGEMWTTPEEVVKKIDSMYKELNKNHLKRQNNVDKIRRKIRIETGLNDDIFTPSIYESTMEIKEDIANLEEEFKELFSKNVKPDLSKVEDHLNNADLNKAGMEMNKFNHKLFKYRKTQEEKNILSNKKRKLPTMFGRGEIDETFFRNEKSRIDNIINRLDEDLYEIKNEITR